MTIFDATALTAAGITEDGALSKVVRSRANIFELTAAAEAAVLRPRQAGGWSHPLRAALAARVARLNAEPALADTYLADAGEYAPLADPANDGTAEGLGAVVAFTDKVAANIANADAADITSLQAAGIADADIVRLAELNAFLAYQIRVIAGLSLMKGSA